MSIDGPSAKLAIPLDFPVEEILAETVKLVKNNNFSIIDEEEGESLLLLVDQLYLTISPNRPIGQHMIWGTRVDVTVGDEDKEVDYDDPDDLNRFMDGSITKYNEIILSADFESYNYSKRRDGSDIPFSAKFIELVKVFCQAFPIIRTTVKCYGNMENFDAITNDFWDDKRITELCNRDIVFHPGTWFAVVNPKYFGGEQKFLDTLKEVYQVLDKPYRKSQGRGIHFPEVEKLGADLLFVKTAPDDYGTEPRIDQDPKLRELFKKLAAEFKD